MNTEQKVSDVKGNEGKEYVNNLILCQVLCFEL